MEKTNIAFDIKGALLDIPFEGCLTYLSDIHVISGRLIFTEKRSIAYFAQLIGGVSVMNLLPPPFSTFTDLSVQSLDMVCDEDTKEMRLIVLRIGTSPEHRWQLLPGMSVSDLKLTCTVKKTEEAEKQASFLIEGVFYIGEKGRNKLSVTATVPNFKAEVSLMEGTILTGDLLTMFWKDVSLDLKSEVTSFGMKIDPTSRNYDLNCGIKSDWTFLSLSAPKLEFTMTGLTLAISGQQGNTTGQVSGRFHIGEKMADYEGGNDIYLAAGYTSKAWAIEGGTGENQSISLIDLVFTFLKPFGIGDIPQWVSNRGTALKVKNILFKAVLPDNDTANNSYSIGGEVEWSLNFSGFNMDLNAAVAISYSANKTSGKITSRIMLLGLDFEIGYVFGEQASDLYLQWKGVRAEYKSDEQQYMLEIIEMSLGEIISKLMAAVIPDFQLAEPWNALNKVSLKNFLLIVDKKNNKITVSYITDLDLGFIQISKINLTKDMTGVFLGFDGTFLGMKIEEGSESTGSIAGKGSNVQNLPTVPGAGEMFDLKLLAMGQHIGLPGSSSFQSVDEAIQCLGDVFIDPNDHPDTIPVGTTGDMVFNPACNWLIGADFTVAKFFRLALIFNDPDLYGLTIGVSEQAKFLKNLQFSILYKKINDTVGVYQTELQLPDSFRHLEFGAVSITLPNIGIQIYTNGDFYLDFGWPTSLSDFSRSFTLQMFPFTGSGGFYFASLSGVTATHLPAVSRGTFNPVIEAGIALSLGVGKSINGGIFKAELYLAAIGMIEGTYAVFNPSDTISAYSGQTDVYYRFAGTLALVGKISCEINFVIISASLEATAYIMASVVIESYKAIPLYFEAGIRVKLTVTVNLGIFKIKVGLNFSTKISASFTIGPDSTQDSLWYKVDHDGNNELINSRLLIQKHEPTCLKWQSIFVSEEERSQLSLYFIPHLTVSSESDIPNCGNSGKYPQYVGMLYLYNPGNGQKDKTGIEALATGCFYWATGAILGVKEESISFAWLKAQDISMREIGLLVDYMEQDGNEPPFYYKNENGNDVRSFMKEFFRICISAPEDPSAEDVSAFAFPIIPDLVITRELNGNKQSTDFSKDPHLVNHDYIRKVHELFDALRVSSEKTSTKRFYSRLKTSCFLKDENEADTCRTLADFVFTDFITLIIKQVLQNASDYMAGKGLDKMKVAELAEIAVNGESPQENKAMEIGGMISRFLLHGLRLPVPPGDVPENISPLYVLTGQQWTIPLEKEEDEKKEEYKYTVSLERKEQDEEWIFIGEAGNVLTILINDELNERNKRLPEITFEPSVAEGYPRAITNIMVIPQSFSLGTVTLWSYPGSIFVQEGAIGEEPALRIWNLPSSFRSVLQENKNKSLIFSLQTITKKGNSVEKGKIEKLKWATSISVKIQKRIVCGSTASSSTDIYELIGVDDSTTHLLESLLVYMMAGNTNVIEQIRLLMQADPLSGQREWISAEDSKMKMAIIKTNMSTETNPEVNMLRGVSTEYNTLNTPEEFITYLWECSIVRSGGFYLYNEGELPEYLFDEDGRASIQLLITYKDFIPEAFLNGAITGDDLDFSKTRVYAQSEDIKMAIPVIPQGCVGYELSRNVPEDFNPQSKLPTLEEDAAYLQNQFNLLGAKLADTEEYQNYMPTGPVLFGEEQEANDTFPPLWQYSKIIPYYKIRGKENYDPIYPNPYIGLGEEVRIKLSWQDMFGNILGNTNLDVSMPVLYTDTIIGVLQWPSVSCTYLFKKEEKDSAPCMQLDFSFDTSRYIDTESGESNALADLDIYKKLYYQLRTGDMSLKIISTIEGIESDVEGFEKKMNITSLVDKFISPIICYLEDRNREVPEPYTLTEKVNCEHIACYSDTIPLRVRMLMTRSGNIDPNFANTPGVAENSAIIQPFQEKKDGVLSLNHFAEEFETAFADGSLSIKVAVSSETLGEGQEIWMVRFDTEGKKGIGCLYDHANTRFFAPRPLATSLQSFSAPITSYRSGEEYSPSNASKKNFSSVDMDVWEKQFLEAMDTFLEPEIATSVFLLDNGKTLTEIITIKEQIADAIAGTVDYIIIPKEMSSACRMNAYEKWRQEILKELSATYKYTAAIQTPVRVCSSWKFPNDEQRQVVNTTPKFYGKVFGDNSGNETDAPDGYNLSTAKLPLGNGNSWLTYMFECKTSSNFRNFKFDGMCFEMSHLEQGIKEIGIGKYTSSRWLTFVLPIDERYKRMGNITVPIPLCTYPVAPAVISQDFVYKGSGLLPEALLWDFDFTYKNTLAAQDTIELQMILNTPEKGRSDRVKNGAPDLRQALAQFMESYSQLNEDFHTYLVHGTEQTKEKAWNAVNAFKIIAQEIATAWASWNQVNESPLNGMQKIDDGNCSILLKYKVIEFADKSGKLNIQVVPEEGNRLNMIPEIRIPEYDIVEQTVEATGIRTFEYVNTETKEPLSYNRRNVNGSRIVYASRLNILDVQNAWGGIQLIRNEELVQNAQGTWEKTNSYFLYQTPVIMFYAKLLPLLNSDVVIDLAEMARGATENVNDLSLETVFETLFGTLCNSMKLLSCLSVKLSVDYSYVISDTNYHVTVPMLLTLPVDLDIHEGGSSFGNLLAQDLNKRLIESGLPDGEFKIELNIYSKLDMDVSVLRLPFVLRYVKNI